MKYLDRRVLIIFLLGIIFISIALSFNAPTVGFLVASSLVRSLIIIIFSWLIFNLFQSFRKKKLGKSVLNIILLLVVASFAYLLSVLFSPMCLAVLVPSHYWTNTITGQCNYGVGSDCAGSEPWYYRLGCPGFKDQGPPGV
ncbi:hypothetical protein MUP65_02390 [Patescibacteria group bacterium]|nr:hypothetical protein [Patescibacteria group bacterium]